jgi:hypothetical protein
MRNGLGRRMIVAGTSDTGEPDVSTHLDAMRACDSARDLLDIGLSRAAVFHALVAQLHLTNREAAHAIRTAGQSRPPAPIASHT